MTTKHHSRGTKEYIADGIFTFRDWVKDASVLRAKLLRMAKESGLRATDFEWIIQPAKFVRVEQPEKLDELEAPPKVVKKRKVRRVVKKKRK